MFHKKTRFEQVVACLINNDQSNIIEKINANGGINGSKIDLINSLGGVYKSKEQVIKKKI